MDGIWGPQTQAAYDAGYRPINYTNVKRTIGTLFGTGSHEKAVNQILDQWNMFTAPQKEELVKLARAYGYEIEEG